MCQICYGYFCCSHIIHLKITGGDSKGKNDLKEVILKEVGQHQIDPKLSEIVTVESGKKKLIALKDLFPGASRNSKNVRTVLMKGVPGVGKTFQTTMFMINWAKGNSSQHIKALVTLDFTELNTKKDEVKRMESLLDDFFNKKNVNVSKGDKKKICFILDGLEKCELPLDFVNNKEVKDLKEAASMDVLLTNLIKGNLLPEAHIWIISQPKGVDKIPSECINKTVHCQGKNICLNLLLLIYLLCIFVYFIQDLYDFTSLYNFALSD